MKQRPLTPSKSSSRTVSRRSRPVRHGALTVALLLVATAIAPAQSLDLSASGSNGPTSVRLAFHWNQNAILIKSLRAGLESRINFTIRLYEARRGWWPFGGDKLLVEKSITRNAYRDRLDEKFTVEQDDGTRRTYAGSDELLAGFFTIDNVMLAPISLAHGRPLYVVARAQFEPVQLMPPLTIVSLVGTTASVATPWVRRDLP
jgi:hypothetical protein